MDLWVLHHHFETTGSMSSIYFKQKRLSCVWAKTARRPQDNLLSSRRGSSSVRYCSHTISSLNLILIWLKKEKQEFQQKHPSNDACKCWAIFTKPQLSPPRSQQWPCLPAQQVSQKQWVWPNAQGQITKIFLMIRGKIRFFTDPPKAVTVTVTVHFHLNLVSMDTATMLFINST